MLITDLIDDLSRLEETEIEFCFISQEGNIKLDLCLSGGKYLYLSGEEDKKDTVILGLEKIDA